MELHFMGVTHRLNKPLAHESKSICSLWLLEVGQDVLGVGYRMPNMQICVIKLVIATSKRCHSHIVNLEALHHNRHCRL